MSIEEISYLFSKEQKFRPILLLGAGASFRSGIPLAEEMIKKIATARYARTVKGMDWRHCVVPPSDWRPFLYRQPWFVNQSGSLVENYAAVIENFLVPRDFRREFFEDVIQPPNGINSGYNHLRELMRRGLCWTVLTTNFDHLIADSFRDPSAPVRDFIEINKVNGDWVRFNIQNRRQIVYLHGSVEYYTDKNLVDEVSRLDDSLVVKIRPLIAGSPLVVVGYRGAEQSIMNHLLYEGADEAHNYPYGIYWCIRGQEDPHPNVLKLQDKIGTNLRILGIPGFDELMEFINERLSDDALYLDPFLSNFPSQSISESFDHSPMNDKTVEDLDKDLILSTLRDYCDRLKIPRVDHNNFQSLLSELGLLTKVDGVLRPSKGCFLLFANDLSNDFPYAVVSFTKDGKKRRVFSGNLLAQYKDITAYITGDEVNPSIRIKKDFTSVDSPAYPVRALVELVVNMLVHRDYQIDEYGTIDLADGKAIRFISPGGLPPETVGRIRINQDGSFAPKRNVSEVRNTSIADIFWGLGPMDKAGSGLADVQELVRENGGNSKFNVLNVNQKVAVTLYQPLQNKSSRSTTARRLGQYETYTTNLLPFEILPSKVYVVPLRDQALADTPLFDPSDKPQELPIFIRHNKSFISFADLRNFEQYAGKYGLLDEIQEKSIPDFIVEDSRLFSWLLSKHWRFFINGKWNDGLLVDHQKRRAYFVLEDGCEQNVIVYNSKSRRNVRRAVVKRRERGRDKVEHENEGIYFSVERFGDTWTIQIKPMYVFTGPDGRIPIPSWLTTQRATRRFKFDRNKNVDDDLSFWARFLGEGKAVRNIGGPGVEDLILGFEYCCAEVVTPERELNNDEYTD